MKKVFKKAITVCAVAVFILNARAGFAQNAKEFAATADGYVYIMERDANYGKEDKILVKRGGRIHNAFVKFNISDQDNVTINKATLKLYCADIENPEIETQIDLFGTESDWAEAKLTYANAPKPTKRLAAVSVDQKGRYYEWDVTTYVQQCLSTGDKEVSFRLSDQEKVNNGVYFNSKEATSNVPLLAIE